MAGGVVLRLEPRGSSFKSAHPNERKDANLLPFHGDTSYAKPSPTSGSFPSLTSYPDLSRSGIKDNSFPGSGATSAPPISLSGSALSGGNVYSDLYNEHRRDHVPQQNPSWSSHYQQHPVSVARTTPQDSNHAFDPAIRGHQSVMSGAVQETYSSTGGISGISPSGNSKPTVQEIKSSAPLSIPTSPLQPEQLAGLTSSLIQQRQVRNTPNESMGENFRQTNTMDQPDKLRQLQGYALQINQATLELSTSQYSQVQQLHQQTSNAAAAVPQAAQRSQQLHGNGIQEEGDADPQKRLQATLQLAAALLQQIQQGKGT